jgi:sensor histidine kinase regulating citrate/malate metabolism
MILARPASAVYQARKFVKRHTALVSATSAVFLALVAVVFASTGQAIRANRERDRAIQETKRADSEAAVARAVNDFLQNDLLAQAEARAQAGTHSNHCLGP